jgi:hypothetical protein
MNPERPNSQENDAIMSAILDGEYSWACVLMLRTMGYNPTEYLPYRTYKRLIDNRTDTGKKSKS